MITIVDSEMLRDGSVIELHDIELRISARVRDLLPSADLIDVSTTQTGEGNSNEELGLSAEDYAL